ncbi:hypothetical protein [Streptomyces sp. IBSBF 2390]|uniref:hypothetical protein n=1 Tax=Streptomyces sp. IBSBF 2390 TaxID=2903533 RepID=UPI002FDBF3A8
MIRLVGYRRLRLPTVGEVRMHNSGKRLARLVDRDLAVVQSVTNARDGHRWYASVLCKVTIDFPAKPRALKALNNAARQDYPTPDTPATRAARLAAQSRERARTAAANAPAAAPRTDAATQQQARHAGLQPGLREGPGLRHA